jgi:hypothetical protein
MNAISTLKEGLQLIKSFPGRAEHFQLRVPESLLDPAGMNMAIITDCALARNWQPDGFVQGDGYRAFRYKELN